MATQSTWRSSGGGGGGGGGPRWGPGANGGNARNTQAASQQAPPSNGPVLTGTSASPMQANAFPPLGRSNTGKGTVKLDADETVQRDRMMYLLVGLVGNTVAATTRARATYVGILSSTSTPDNGNGSLGVVLSCAQQILPDKTLGPIKNTLMIKGDDLDGIVARDVGLDVPVSMKTTSDRASFRTDTEISNAAMDGLGQGRLLQKWTGDTNVDLPLDGNASSNSTGAWDQFAANEAKFGIKSNYEESMYTTKLDRSTKDYKERERKAEQLAREIMSSTTTNTHIAEERNLNETEAAQTEEDKYGAVARNNANAYVPPGARRAAAAATASASISARINGANNGAESKLHKGSAASNAPSIVATAPSTGADAAVTEKQKQDATGEFQKFVTGEKERVSRQKAALHNEKVAQKKNEFKSWSEKLNLSFPVPDDVAMLSQSRNNGANKHTDGDAQLRASEKPRDPTLQKSLSPTPSNSAKAQAADGTIGSASALHSPAGAVPPRASPVSAEVAKALSNSSSTSKQLADTKAAIAKMTIPMIPPFDAGKARARREEAALTAAGLSAAVADAKATEGSTSSKAVFKMSAKAGMFKPFNPNAAAFTPGSVAGASGPASVATSSRVSTEPSPSLMPAVVQKVTGPPPNAFFGNRLPKKQSTSLHVREDFNTFKTGKVPLASTVGPVWGFTGKPYRQLFHAIPSDDSAAASSSSQQHTPQQHHAAILQAGVMSPGLHGGPMGGLGQQLPPPPHLVGQQAPPTMAPTPSQGQQGQQPFHPQQPGQQHHILAHHQQGMPHGNAAAAAAAGQPIYLPYGGGYRFQGGQQQPMHHMAGHYMTPQFVGHQMPFSPPMAPNGPPPTLYSPQMQNMMATPPPNMMPGGAGGPLPPQQRGGSGGGGHGHPSHMQPKGIHAPPPPPPHMYYPSAAQPGMPGMPYGAPPFPPSAGPSPVVRNQQHQPQQQQGQTTHNLPLPPAPQQHGQQAAPPQRRPSNSASSSATPTTANEQISAAETSAAN